MPKSKSRYTEEALRGKPRYDYKIDVSNENSSHTKILRLVEKDRYVLEIGCATGYMTRHLKEELGCRVVCVEIDPESGEMARPYCDELIIQDVDEPDFDKALSDRRFDVIIMADVLEHLKDQRNFLRKLRNFIGESGYILLSVPNGAHGSLALELLDGKWEYRPEGLLDSTHLHFLDRDSLSALLDETGFLISRMDRVTIHPRDTEMKTPWESYPREVTAYLEKVNPEYQTYQFIVKAYPTSAMGWKKGLKDALESEKRKERALEDELKSSEAELISLKEELAGFEAEKAEIRRGYEAEITKQGEAKAEIRRRYEAEITKQGEEKAEIRREYEAEITRQEEGKAEIRRGYKAEITRQEEEKAEIRRAHETENARSKQETGNLQAEVAHLRIESLHLRKDLAGLQQEKSELEGTVYRQWQWLHEINSSLVWRSLSRYRTIIERWLPQGSRRRRLYRLSVLAPVVLFREGPRAFFQKIAARLPLVRRPGGVAGSREQSMQEWHPLTFPRFDEKDVSIIIPVYNQCVHTFRCLEFVLRHSTLPYEVIVVDNASDGNTSRMLDAMEGIQVIHNQENQGFVTACNQGANAAAGKYCLALNNDTEVTAGWLEALSRPFEDEQVGIVGAKLIYPDGRLQEAGNIIWQDGTGWNYGRGDSPDLPQYSYLREVDYCSGACLMIQKDLWQRLGGFDLRYAPAYYEDSDICFAARQLGYKVMYQPEACIIHWEGVSAGVDVNRGYKKYQQTNLVKFREKWREALKRDHFKGPEDLYLARERGFLKRVLVVDHYVPTYDMDSGSLRMFSLLKIFKALGYKVVFWPENRAFHERYTRELQGLGIEVLYGEINFEEYLVNYGRYIDLILLSRPHIAINFIHAARTLTKARIIYDTVDLNFLREERRVRIEAERASEYWKKIELFLAHQADDTLVVSPIEKEILENEGLQGKVSVISNIHTLEFCKKSFEQREGLMFIGGFMHLPNEDGIAWFVEKILPLIRQKLPEVKLFIVGSHPAERVKSLGSSNVIVTGYVEDVAPYFESARVFVCPLRYGAGVKGKIGQSMAYGLPVVTTSIGAEGIGLSDGHDALIDDSEELFANKVVEVYQDQRLWETLSLNGRQLIEKNYTPEVMKKNLRMLL